MADLFVEPVQVTAQRLGDAAALLCHVVALVEERLQSSGELVVQRAGYLHRDLLVRSGAAAARMCRS
jgi:hypothetical protein